MSDGDRSSDDHIAAVSDFAPEPAHRQGAETARVGTLLERYRQYLLAIAVEELPPQLAGKIGASDLVQETIVKGYEHIGSFAGTSPEQLACWLRQILLNHLRNVAKAYGAEKRDVAREQPMDSRMVAGGALSPSRELISRERMERFQNALDQLPEDRRQVILLRHREDLSFAEIGHRLGTSEDTARRIWARAIRQLQAELHADESSARWSADDAQQPHEPVARIPARRRGRADRL